MADRVSPASAKAAPQRSRLTLYFTLSVCFLAVTFLLVIPSGLIGLAFILGGALFFGVICLHYVVWGRWMDRILRDEQREELD